MKITKIDTYRVTLPTDIWVLVAIQTDEGITGWGEVTGSLNDEGLAHIISQYSDWVVGKSPLEMKECLSYFKQWTYPVTNNIRVNAAALSGIDQALWDINAKYRGLPLYQLLGGTGSDQIPLYANLNKALRGDRSLAQLEANTKQALAEGFRIVKCTPFDEISPERCDCWLEAGLERLQVVVKIAGISHTAIDCHQRFQRYTLSRMTEAVLKQFGQPFWLEDPVDSADFKTLQIMHHCFPGVRWAAGEDALNIQQLHTEVVSDCYEVLMPDVKYIGGPSVIRAVIPYLEALNVKISIHNPNGVIATAHSAHLTALCSSSLPMEFAFRAVPEREQLCSKKEIIKDGCYQLSNEPGIGVELSRDALREYAQVYHNGHWDTFKDKEGSK